MCDPASVKDRKAGVIAGHKDVSRLYLGGVLVNISQLDLP